MAVIVPLANSDDDDDVVVALETARVEAERGSPQDAARWLQRAASSARKQGRPDRAGELSRAAAQLGRESNSSSPPKDSDKFERRPEQEHVLSEDDFADETIVDNRESLAGKLKQDERRLLPGGTPVAPGVASQKSKPDHYLAIRVAVRRVLGGRLEVRRLSQTDELAAGEEEALLVPTRSGHSFN